jgi:ABC-type branched-subunit amino acid transport system substrate-binding protein
MNSSTTSTGWQRKKSLAYWDELREGAVTDTTLIGVARNDSAVVSIDDFRLAHILSIMPSSQIIASSGERIPADDYIYMEAAGFLAMQHFNEREGRLLPHLPERLGDCNLYLTMEMKDSTFSAIQATSHLFNSIIQPHSVRTPRPASLLGAYRSAVSLPLSSLSGAYQIPHMNCGSTSSVLDNKDTSPTFMRTVPTNALDAQAAVLYFRQLNVLHFGVFFVRDAYGSQYASDLGVAAAASNMFVTTFPYEDGNPESIRKAMRAMKDSGLRYLFGVVSAAPSIIKLIVREGIDVQMMGNADYHWVLGDGGFPLSEPGFYETTLKASDQGDREIAQAISGFGMIIYAPPRNLDFEEAMLGMGSDKELMDHYVAKHNHPKTFDDFNFTATQSLYQYLNYDAVMAIGVALCDSEQEFIAPEQLLHQMKSTDFVGVSGRVSFDPLTGTRATESVAHQVINILIDVTPDEISFEARRSSFIKISTGEVELLRPFIYADGTIEVPLSLPAVEQDLNLVPDGVRAYMWSLSGLVILSSIGFAWWTYKFRKKSLVRVAQPIFLYMSCVGTLLMAISILPLSLQEPVSQQGLDFACMAFPWLFVMGFGTASSAILCKTIRINRVFKEAQGMRRAEIKAKDVLWPFVLITSINAWLLLIWTAVSPSLWRRTELQNVDRYGRSVESIGQCDYAGDSSHTYFMGVLLGVNIIFVILGNYQSLQTREMPSPFNEAYYLALSMASILESFLIGLPLLILVHDSPEADLTVRSTLIAVICLAIQLPLFVSKLIIKRKSRSPNRRYANDAWSNMLSRKSRYSDDFLVGHFGLSHALGTSSRNHRDLCGHSGRSSLAPTTNTIDEIRARAALADKKVHFVASAA